MRGVCLILGLMVAAPGVALAQEAVGYVYDVHGRVVQLTHCGSVNDERRTTYAYDDADNRTERERDGAGSCPLALAAAGGTIDNNLTGDADGAMDEGPVRGDRAVADAGGGGDGPDAAADTAGALFD